MSTKAKAEQQHDGLHDGIVALRDRLHGELAHAGPGEDGLGHHRAAEQRPDLQPEDGHDRDHGVLERVPEDHEPGRESLGPSSPDVVLCQDLEHARARQAYHQTHEEDRERDAREDQVREAPAAGHRQQAKLDREERDQDQADPEVRRGLGEERHVERQPVPSGMATKRGEHSDGNAEAGRQEEGAERELERRRQALEDVRQDRTHGPDRLAEVAPDGARHEPPVLLAQGPVEAEALPHLGHSLGRCLVPEQKLGRIPGHRVEQQEHDQADSEQQEERVQGSLRDVGQRHRPDSSGPVRGSHRRGRPRTWVPPGHAGRSMGANRNHSSGRGVKPLIRLSAPINSGW